MSLTASLSYRSTTPAVNERSRFEVSSVVNDDNNGNLPFLLDIPDELPSSGNTRLREELPLSLRAVRRRLQPRRSSPVNDATQALHEPENSMVNNSSSQGLYEGATGFCRLPQVQPFSLNEVTEAERPVPEFLALPELPSPSLFVSEDEDSQIRRDILQNLPMPPPLARLLPHPVRPSEVNNDQSLAELQAFPQDLPVESTEDSSLARPPPMIRLQRKPAVPLTPVRSTSPRPVPQDIAAPASAADVDNSLTGWLSMAANAEAQQIRAATATATATPPLPPMMPPPSVYLPDMF